MKTTYKVLSGAAVLAAAVAIALHGVAATAFIPDNQPVGYVAAPLPSSVNVSKGDGKMYSVDYSARDWSGNLHSYPISSGGTISTVDDWGSTGVGGGGASAKIKAQSVADTRYIVTGKGIAGSGAGQTFRWASLSTGAGGQRQALDNASYASSATSSPILDYIRGSAANEGTASGKYRVRNAGMGDIIHSTPVYWNDGTRRTVFVGANDGMLHAINAADGSERFAYIPSILLPRLSQLTNQVYSHGYFVDGRMDVKTMGSQTILAGTLAAGGKALYALDVTNAQPTSEADAAAKVLWEITNTSSGFAELGYTYGAPTLTTLPSGVNAVVTGNGYNNTGNGHAVLYVINASTGALIKAYDTGSGTTASPNGLSSPSLWDTDGDGKKDTAYAGDIDGNVWRFSLVAPYTAPVKLVHANTGGASFGITMAPGLIAHPLGGVLVEFVTGRMLVTADGTDTARHYAYGVWDGAPALNDTWLDQTLTEANFVSGGTTIRVRTATDNVPNWTSGAGHHKGWRTQLPIGGERVVGDGAFITGGIFQFVSTNPTISPGAIPPGENWWMQLNALTGGDTGTTLFDLNNDSRFTSDDQVSVTLNGQTRAEDPVGRHMGGGIRSQLVALSATGVDVYQSNFDKNSAPLAPVVTTTTAVVAGERGVSGGHFDTDFFCYNNCGASTSSYKTINAAAGVYSIGTESGGATDNLNYVHVHEYDDIYDRVGINMFHPSQDMQRLRLAKVSTASSTAPDTPTMENNNTYPSTGVTMISTVTETGKTASRVPDDDYSYSDTATTQVTGYPTTVATATSTVVTNKVKYTTTLSLSEAINIGSRNSARKYPYDLRKTVRKWDTVITTTETTPNTQYKVLMANQAYSPAVKFKIAGAVDSPAKTNASYDDSAFRYMATTGVTVASLPSYKMNGTTNEMMFYMPLDAFNNRNWGTGVTRTGVHPIKPQCAGVATSAPTNGPLGEWRNGALTVQIVDASITDSDIQLNVSGHPELGYRLKTTSMPTKLIAEYLVYWHHPSQTCMADSGWSRTPAQDTSDSDAINGVWAPGEADPKGVFTSGSGESTTVVPDPPAPTVVTNANGSITTTTVTNTAIASGGYTVTTVVSTVFTTSATGSAVGIVTGGAVSSNGTIDTSGIDKNAANLGRINWRELQK